MGLRFPFPRRPLRVLLPSLSVRFARVSIAEHSQTKLLNKAKPDAQRPIKTEDAGPTWSRRPGDTSG